MARTLESLKPLEPNATREQFEKHHAEFLEILDQDASVPLLGGRPLDVQACFKEVTNRGGFDEVVSRKLWKEVTAALDLPPSLTAASFSLRIMYIRLLYQYEQRFFFNKPADSPEVRTLPPQSLGAKVYNSSDYSAMEQSELPPSYCPAPLLPPPPRSEPFQVTLESMLGPRVVRPDYATDWTPVRTSQRHVAATAAKTYTVRDFVKSLDSDIPEEIVRAVNALLSVSFSGTPQILLSDSRDGGGMMLFRALLRLVREGVCAVEMLESARWGDLTDQSASLWNPTVGGRAGGRVRVNEQRWVAGGSHVLMVSLLGQYFDCHEMVTSILQVFHNLAVGGSTGQAIAGGNANARLLGSDKDFMDTLLYLISKPLPASVDADSGVPPEYREYCSPFTANAFANEMAVNALEILDCLLPVYVDPVWVQRCRLAEFLVDLVGTCADHEAVWLAASLLLKVLQSEELAPLLIARLDLLQEMIWLPACVEPEIVRLEGLDGRSIRVWRGRDLIVHDSASAGLIGMHPPPPRGGDSELWVWKWKSPRFLGALCEHAFSTDLLPFLETFLELLCELARLQATVFSGVKLRIFEECDGLVPRMLDILCRCDAEALRGGSRFLHAELDWSGAQGYGHRLLSIRGTSALVGRTARLIALGEARRAASRRSEVSRLAKVAHSVAVCLENLVRDNPIVYPFFQPHAHALAAAAMLPVPEGSSATSGILVRVLHEVLGISRGFKPIPGSEKQQEQADDASTGETPGASGDAEGLHLPLPVVRDGSESAFGGERDLEASRDATGDSRSAAMLDSRDAEDSRDTMGFEPVGESSVE